MTHDEFNTRGSSEEELKAHKKKWRPDQQWEFRTQGTAEWKDYPRGSQPGWFYDSQYRLKSS